jgi:hypothetical protein
LAYYCQTMSPGSIRTILFLETRLELSPNGGDGGVRRTLRVLPVLPSEDLHAPAARDFEATFTLPIRKRFSECYGAAKPQKVQSYQGTHGSAL